MWWKQTAPAIFADEIQEHVLSDLRQFFGPRPEPYLNIYERMRQAKSVNLTWTWSWPVFFLGFVWFFYRKMFLMGAMTLLLPFVAAVLFGGQGMGGAAGVFAIFAKPFYVQTAISRIEKADALGLVGAEQADYLKRAGGVSPIAGGFAAVLYALFLAAVLHSTFTK